MTIFVNGMAHEIADGSTLADAVRALSPYGGEPVAVLLNGERVADDDALALHPQDELRIYPLLIGG